MDAWNAVILFTLCLFTVFVVLRIANKGNHQPRKNSEETGGKPRDRPRRFYSIQDNGDGTADVYLIPAFTRYMTDVGIDEYDMELRVIRGIVPWEGMEDDIRMRYDAWCDSAEVVDV